MPPVHMCTFFVNLPHCAPLFKWLGPQCRPGLNVGGLKVGDFNVKDLDVVTSFLGI